MRERVAEHRVVSDRPGRGLRLRVDLHGVSVFGPGDLRTLIRWEWISGIDATDDGVVVRSPRAELTFPPGAFGLQPAALADRLRRARSITERPDLIGELAHGPR